MYPCFGMGRLQSLFFCSRSEVRSLLCFTVGESPVVSGDCCLNLSGTAIKLIHLIKSSAVRKAIIRRAAKFLPEAAHRAMMADRKAGKI